MTDEHQPPRMEDDWEAAQKEMQDAKDEERTRPDDLTAEAARRLINEAAKTDERLTDAQRFAHRERLNELRGLKKQLGPLGYFTEEMQAELDNLEERFKDK